jgi:hypothetical protein
MVPVNCKPKPFRNLYLAYFFICNVKPKPKSKSKSQPVKKPKTKNKKSLDSKSSPTDKPKTSRTVTETVSKGGTPFLKRKKRVRSSSPLESTSLQLR